MFPARTGLIKNLTRIDRLATGIFLLAPLVFLIVKASTLLFLKIYAGTLLLATHTVVRRVTLLKVLRGPRVFRI